MSDSKIQCPACGYSGRGFHHIEFVPCVSEVFGGRHGTPLTVRTDRAEMRPDEVRLEDSRLECPWCEVRFLIPQGTQLVFVPRSAAA